MKSRRLSSLFVVLVSLFAAGTVMAEEVDASKCTSVADHQTAYEVNGTLVRESNATWRCTNFAGTVFYVYVKDVSKTNSTQPGDDHWTRDQYADPEYGQRTHSWEGYGTGLHGTPPREVYWYVPPSGNADTRLIDSSDSCSNCGW